MCQNSNLCRCEAGACAENKSNNDEGDSSRMPVFNAMTGAKRRRPRRNLPRKKRSLASTPASEMFSREAMEAFDVFMAGARLHLAFLSVLIATDSNLDNPGVVALCSTVSLGGSFMFSSAMKMVTLDSELMDLTEEEIANAGYRNPLVGITLDSFHNDDDCEDKTRFTKDGMRSLLNALPLGLHTRVHCNGNVHYKFLTEELLIYVLRRMATARMHKDLADIEFGGCSKRWGTGYNFLVKFMDGYFRPLIGPGAVRIWVNRFPECAENIRGYLMRDRAKKDGDGNVTEVVHPQFYINEGEFNIFGFIDCAVHEICRPGSGPANAEDGAPRNENWCVKQRAFYDGYHRGMEACLKILTICLPNGLTAAVCGPTSGKDNDIELFKTSELDGALRECQEEVHAGDLHCACGDGIFAGYWHCLRTCHCAPPGYHLTPQQEEENTFLKSVRECVEWSYAKAESNWPLLNTKHHAKLEVDSGRTFAEVRVMYFLTNCRICLLEGSAMTGNRGFRCVPPTLDEYLALNTNN